MSTLNLDQLTIIGYFIYLPVTLSLTWQVARILFKSGKIFMEEIFNKDLAIAGATNDLFKIGFYLFNFGFAFLTSEFYFNQTATYQKLFEVLSNKLGYFSIYLGIILFVHLVFFMRARNKALATNRDVPAITEVQIS